MRFFKDIYTGSTQTIIEEIPVYNATSLSNGQLLMIGTTDPDGGADQSLAFVNAYTGTNAEAVNVIGLTQSKGGNTDDYGSTVDVTLLPSNVNPPYLRAIVNAGAVYLAEYDQTTTFGNFTTAGTALTQAALEDDIDNSWIFVKSSLVSGNAYNLRQVTASAAGSCTLDSVLSGGNETQGTAIKILKVNHKLTALNTAGTGLLTAAAAGAGIYILIRENWVDGDGTNLVRLRNKIHRGTNWNANTKFFAEIRPLHHVYDY